MTFRRLAAVVLTALTAVTLVVGRPASANLFGDRRPDEYQAEKDMFSLINHKRASLATPERRLVLDTVDRRDARDNSDDMAKSQQFERPFVSARGACATVGRSAENTDYETAVRQIFREWMGHTATRACILERKLRFGGVGVTRGDNFTYWMTFIGSVGQGN